jgi:hypothetical protein
MPAHRLREHGIEKVQGSRAVTPEAEPPEAEPAAPQSVADVVASVTETAPKRPGLMDRIRSRRGRGRGGAAAPASRERAPRPAKRVGRRVALDGDISDIWGFAGRRLESTPHFATGRMLEYQAPAAGLIIDRAVAGTLPDRVLFQPLARNRDKYEDVGFLLAGPLLTFSITQNGMSMEAMLARRTEWTEEDIAAYQGLAQKQEMLKEMFVWVARMMLPRLAEGVTKAREKKAKDDAAIAEAFPDLAGGTDPVEEFAAMLFTPPTFQEASQNGKPDPAPASATAEGSGTF